MSERTVSAPQLDPVHCISNNLHKTARAVSRVYAEEMRPAGLARSQFAVLEHLDRGGPAAVSELARHLYMERTTLTRNLRPLQQAGLVTRTAQPGDARVKLIAITDSGRDRLETARDCWRRAQARLLEQFGAEAWAEVEAALRKLRRLTR